MKQRLLIHCIWAIVFAAMTIFSTSTHAAESDPPDSVLKARIKILGEMEEEDTARYASFARTTIAMAQATGETEPVAVCHQYLITYFLVGPVCDLDRAAQELEVFRQYVEKTGEFKSWFYILWQNLILLHYDESHIVQAALEVQRMLEYAREREDFYGLACTHTLMGYFNEECSYETAMENYSLALKYAQISHHEEKRSYIYQSMAHAAYFAGKYDETFDYIEKALVSDPAPKQEQSSDCLRMSCYLKMDNQAEAKKCYERLKRQWDEGNIVSSYRRTVAQALCQYLCRFGNPDESIPLWKEVEEPLEPQALYYKAKGDYERAYMIREQLDSIKHVANMERQQAEIANAYYKNKQLQYENQQLALDNEKSESQRRFVTIIALLVLLAMAAFIIYREHRHNHLLNVEREKAVHMNEMKTSFINSMSHEVRTPISAINGFNDLLHSGIGFSEEEQKAMLAQICEQSDALVRLLGKVIYISRIDGDDIKPALCNVPLDDVCHKAVDMVTEKLLDGVTIDLQTLDTTVQIDPELLQTALVEVLDNAVKFTEAGTIRLTVAPAEAPAHVEIAVANPGAVIPASAAEQVFERFEKLDSFKPGFGLGLSLSIARHLLALMGGSIRLDTACTTVTRFVLTV